MIFGDDAPGEEPAPVSDTVTAGELLLSCLAEAERLAIALARVDLALSAVIGELADPPHALQGIDLLRQEADGLASALRLVAGGWAFGARLPEGAIARAISLHDQRDRLRRGVAGRVEEGCEPGLP